MNNLEIIKKAKERINFFDDLVLSLLRNSRPEELHEKAHAFPISVPEIWSIADENILKFNYRIDRPLRLYIHIPWCKRKCIFCFYESDKCIPSDEVVTNYFHWIEMELSYYLSRFGKDKFVAETLYLGGGTPSILSPKQIDKLLNIIHSKIDFTSTATLVTEASPGTITNEKIKAFKVGGINRVSIGVQSFEDHILEKCSRDHNSQEAIEAYRIVRKNDIPEVNFDLMLALPDQSLEDFAETVHTTLKLRPSSISFLDLRVAPGSYLHKLGFYYPSWKEDIFMRAIYQEMLSQNKDYIRTRPHYYILPEEARGRSTRVPCLDSREGNGFQIGLGVTSYGHLGNNQYVNHKNPDYSRLLQSGKLPINYGLKLKTEDITAMKAIRAIVDYSLVPNADDVLLQYPELINYLKINKLIDDKLELTEDGCLFGEEITYLFYPDYVKRMINNDEMYFNPLHLQAHC
jgi:coproporphyrinogen III oxidase-like Fe-S oxidoreductase